MTSKPVVALLFGGRSSEHSVSCATAAGVLAAIDRTRYDVVPIGITREGAFVLERDDPAAFALENGHLADVADNGTRLAWPEQAGSRTLTFTSPGGGEPTRLDVDVVFPLLHGSWGEDGTIQGLLESYSIPYVGSGVLASAAAMDKHFTKTVLQAEGVAVAPWVTVRPREWARDAAGVATRVLELGLPVFVKPARAGSSVGVSRVERIEDLGDALATAFGEDDKVLVEAAVVGRELEIAVLGGRDGASPRASVAGEIVVAGGGFYDFDAKYLEAESAQLVCPAPLSEAELAEMRRLAVHAFAALDCRGLARVDFFLTERGFVLNEVNTMPGFTPISMFPKCWEASGIRYPELITELIELALEL